MGLGRGKNNNGEVKICPGDQVGWEERENMVLDTGRVEGLFRSNEKGICVNIRQVRRGYYSREPIWGEPLLGSGQGK